MAKAGLLMTSLLFLVYILFLGSPVQGDERVSGTEALAAVRKDHVCPHGHTQYECHNIKQEKETAEKDLLTVLHLQSKHRENWHRSERKRRSTLDKREVNIDRRRQLYNEFLRRVLRKNRRGGQKNSSSTSGADEGGQNGLETSTLSNGADRSLGEGPNKRKGSPITTTLNPLRPSRNMDADTYRRQQLTLQRRRQEQLQRLREVHRRRYLSTTGAPETSTQRHYTSSSSAPFTTAKPRRKTKPLPGSTVPFVQGKRRPSKYGISKKGKFNGRRKVTKSTRKKKNGKRISAKTTTPSKWGKKKKKKRKGNNKSSSRKRKKSRGTKNSVDTSQIGTDPFISESKAKDYLTRLDSVTQSKKNPRQVIWKERQIISKNSSNANAGLSDGRASKNDIIYDIEIDDQKKTTKKLRMSSGKRSVSQRLGKRKKSRNKINKDRIARLRRNRLKLLKKRKNNRKKKRRNRKNSSRSKTTTVSPSPRISTVLPSSSSPFPSFSSSSSSPSPSSPSSSSRYPAVANASTVKRRISSGAMPGSSTAVPGTSMSINTGLVTSEAFGRQETEPHSKMPTSRVSQTTAPMPEGLKITTAGTDMPTVQTSTVDSTSGSRQGEFEPVEVSASAKSSRDKEIESTTKDCDENKTMEHDGNVSSDNETLSLFPKSTVLYPLVRNVLTENLGSAETFDNVLNILEHELNENKSVTNHPHDSTTNTSENTSIVSSDNEDYTNTTSQYNTSTTKQSGQTAFNHFVTPSTTPVIISSLKGDSNDSGLDGKMTSTEERNLSLSASESESSIHTALNSSASSTRVPSTITDKNNRSANPQTFLKDPPPTAPQMLTFSLATYGKRETSSTLKPQEGISSKGQPHTTAQMLTFSMATYGKLESSSDGRVSTRSSKDQPLTTPKMLTFSSATYSHRLWSTSMTTSSKKSSDSPVIPIRTSKRTNSNANSKWREWAKRRRNRKKRKKKKKKKKNKNKSKFRGSIGPARGSVAFSLSQSEESRSDLETQWVLTTKSTTTTTEGPFIGHKTAYDFLSNQKGIRRVVVSEKRREANEINRYMGEHMCEIFNKHYVPTQIGGKCV